MMTDAAAPALVPDKDAIRADLEWMTRRWSELDQPAWFEVRALLEGAQPQTFKFRADWINDAVETIADMNARQRNVYVTRNPLRDGFTGSATDADVIAAFALWADCDDAAAAQAARDFDGPKWTAAVITGKTPSTRVHCYWELQDPITDLGAWRNMQERIAARLGSDRTVVNPSRIMRVAGTVSWPAPRKAAKGYIPEVVQMKADFSTRSPVTPDSIGVFLPDNVFSLPLSQMAAHRESGFHIEAEPQHHDANHFVDILRRARTDGEKHGGVRDLAAHLAGSGVKQSMAEAIIREACPVWDANVEELIRSAYVKFAPVGDYAKPEALSLSVTEQSFDAPPKNLKIEWFDDIQPALTDAYLIKNVLSQSAMSVLYGASNSGKSFFAMDLAFSLSTATPWRGRRVIKSAVLYLAAEGGKGVANRIAALKKESGVVDVPFALRRGGMDLLKAQADLQAVCDMAAEVAAKRPGLPLIIIIDTLSRIMAGGDENNAADMTALIRNLDAIREMTGAHIMLIHHSGKDTARGARGHSSLRAATDTEMEVQNEDGMRAAIVTKQREYPGGETFAFTLKTVTLGTDQDGDEVSSCVVECAENEEFTKARKKLTKNQKALVDCFDQMIADGVGKPNHGGPTMPDPGRFMMVSYDDFRKLAEGKLTAKNTRDAFLSAFDALNGQNGLFCLASGFVWRTDRPIK